MTASKRPNRLAQWIDALHAYLLEHASPDKDSPPRHPPEPARAENDTPLPDGQERASPDGKTPIVPLDSFTELTDIWRRMAEGDRRSFAVAMCFYKLTSLRDRLPELQQRRGGTAGFEVVRATTGKILNSDLEGMGLPEFVLFPKSRWLKELHISNVLRLHRAGFSNPEIAGLLPNNDHRTPADIRRDAKAVQGIIQKYRAAARHDLGTTPADWPLRV